MSKAAELAALIGSQTALSNRNLLINGGMTISQRSVSETAQHTTGYITCDRFNISFVNEDQLRQTITQEADGPSGFSKSLKLQTTTAESAVAADEAQRIIYRAEGQDLQSLGFGTSAAKKFTISFYVKSSVAATYGFNAYIYDADKVFGQAYTINSPNTWERKSITFDANTSNAITDDNTVGLQINWFLIAGSNYTSGSNSGWETFAQAKHAVGHTANAFGTTTNATWQITGVQLEIGEQATSFEHRLFGDELARCQRYFVAFSDLSGNNRYFGTRYGDSNGFVNLACPVTMRATPTLSRSSDGSFSSNLAFSAFSGGTDDMCQLLFQASSSSTNCFVTGLVGDCDAEL
jgi:hypothetical protein